MKSKKSPNFVHAIHEGDPEQIANHGVVCVLENKQQVRTRDGHGEQLLPRSPEERESAGEANEDDHSLTALVKARNALWGASCLMHSP